MMCQCQCQCQMDLTDVTIRQKVIREFKITDQYLTQVALRRRCELVREVFACMGWSLDCAILAACLN